MNNPKYSLITFPCVVRYHNTTDDEGIENPAQLKAGVPFDLIGESFPRQAYRYSKKRL